MRIHLKTFFHQIPIQSFNDIDRGTLMNVKDLDTSPQEATASHILDLFIY